MQVGPASQGQASDEENIARRIEWEMIQRGWSQERLSKEMTDVGCPMHQSSISKIVKPRERRRSISVDEAVAFARVFKLSLDELRQPIEVLRNQEIHLLRAEIGDLTSQREVLRARLLFDWLRLDGLTGDEKAFDSYVEWLSSDKEMGPDAARKYAETWGRGVERPTSAAFDWDVPIPLVLRIRSFVMTIRSTSRSSIEGWLTSFAPAVFQAGLGEEIARLVNDQLTNKGVSDDQITEVVQSIDRYLLGQASVVSHMDDELDLYALAASTAARFHDGESVQEIAESLGIPFARLRHAYAQVGLLIGGTAGQ
ncbi:hypothetical protein Aple_025450 [Acrocarpospora pleiomorpha]|uniref:Uncharacterized protein n=1 Tax=Acrocarpospora pleiomorpha TaxID=90975 RepID=A0A5M3XHG8_9ACTN|nr:helix-turn-helix transcriptional regulator [Acrocarpospora pleiomorpha]GES19649.1 hypothetical protein Aple_025450 [Acrocarpospora pleiomorpha]